MTKEIRKWYLYLWSFSRINKGFSRFIYSRFQKASSENKNLTLEEILKNHIIDGEKLGLEDQLSKALKNINLLK